MSHFDPSNNDCVRHVYNFESVYDYNRNGFNVFITSNDMKRLVKSCVDMEDGNTYSGPMLWIGIYVAITSFFCSLAMAADLFHGFRNRKFWFPCKYFSLNAASITVLTVAMKLPVDLSNSMPGYVDQTAKLGSMAFMCVMMANLMPSLASMDNKTLLANIIGLAILIIPMIVNICIQLTTNVIENRFFSSSKTKYDLMSFRIWACIYTVLMFLLLLILISLAITIPSSKKILELKYQAMSKTISNDQHIGMPIIEKLRQYVRRYWVMAESGSPQFVIATNPLSNACGIICMITLVSFIVIVLNIYFSDAYKDHQSDYKWATLAIFVTQFIGVIVGSIAPIFRCFTVLSFNLFSGNHLMVFKVEKYWTQKLWGWKESRLPFLSDARKSRACVHNLKNLILSFCIRFQNIVVVSCKMIGLIRVVLIILVMRCLYYWKSLKALLFNTHVASSSDDTNVDLSNYVLQIQDEMEFAETTVKGISNSMNHLIKKVKKEQHNDLLELLGISTSFEGVEKFDIDQVESLLSFAHVNTWSLPIVTLTCIAVALPNIHNDKATSLLKGVGDGFSYIYLVEESFNSAREYVNVQRATVNLWHEIEANYKWLDNTLKRNAYKGKTATEILKWFADKAGEIVIEVSTKGELLESFPNKLIVANSMYRIAQTILLNFQSNIEACSEEQLFALLSCMISDILSACLTNIPRLIATKCHEIVIEKREASVEAAARLLGRSEEIIRKLEGRELPSMDPNKMAFIDEWRLHLKRSIP
ncbi:hypothetical protein OROHE_018989 [Orobanche hederae]